jgi:iron complex transport system substrate-binding protein
MFWKKEIISLPLAVAGVALIGLMGLSAWARQGKAVEEKRGGKPSRIVSLAPSVTEILFAIGLDREIVGVTDFCNYPKAAKSRPRVGGFKGKSLEAIVALGPDLVIGTRDGNEAPLMATLDRLNIPVLSLEPATLSGVIDSVRRIGAATGRVDEAEALARDMEARLEFVRTRVQGRPPVRVLFVYGRDPLVLAGPETFADDMIRLSGGVNAAADARMPYPRFSMEAVLARTPEVIVEGRMGDEGGEAKLAEAMNFWGRFESLPAVANGRVTLIDEDLIARPGPRLFDGLIALARVLHPEAFAAAAP